jgi:pimeloyl-ACP methyl ester carboxylesterase
MLALIKLWLRFLSAVAPRAAARAGARLWFRVGRLPIAPEARAVLDSAERFEVRTKDSPVVGWRWGSGPAVLLMHGWGGRATQMLPFVEPLVKSGHCVIAFDAPSHGDSGPSALGPKSATLFDFSDALAAASDGAGPMAAVIAHSGGCAAAAWTMVRFPGWRPARMVFVAPFGSPARYMKIFSQMLGLSEKAMEYFRANTEAQFNLKWADFEVAKLPDRVATPPLLIFHDKNDRETSWQDGADIAASWPNARLETTTGLGHNRILRDPNVVTSAVAFIASRT